KRVFGLTLQERDTIIERQDGKCAICGQVPRLSDKPQNGRRDALCVDHCHRSGKVRGLLCDDCNRGLGSFKDDVTTLRRAIKYLKEYQDETAIRDGTEGV